MKEYRVVPIFDNRGKDRPVEQVMNWVAQKTTLTLNNMEKENWQFMQAKTVNEGCLYLFFEREIEK